MKNIRWTLHAREALRDREVPEEAAEQAVHEPEAVVVGRHGRSVMVRRYEDPVLERQMVVCVVVEEREAERVVVTVYKTSKLEKYFRGGGEEE